jgi:hypothetical protein
VFREVVIVHELLHLLVPNHGKLFKSLLNAYLPGWEKAAQGGLSPHYSRRLGPSFVEARPGRARRAGYPPKVGEALPTADGVSLSRREGACPRPLRADGIATRSTRT